MTDPMKCPLCDGHGVLADEQIAGVLVTDAALMDAARKMRADVIAQAGAERAALDKQIRRDTEGDPFAGADMGEVPPWTDEDPWPEGE